MSDSSEKLLHIIIKATDQTGDVLKDLGGHIANVSNKAPPALQAMNSFSNGVLKTTGAVTAFGLGVGGLSVKMASDYQKVLRETSANLNLTTEQQNELEKSIRSTMMISPSSMESIAEAYRTLGSEGFTVAESQNIVAEANKAAITTGDDIGKIAGAMGFAMHDYGMKSTDAARALDILHNSMAFGNMTMEQITPVLGNLISVTSMAGVSFEETAAAMSVMTASGTDAAEAATSLRNATLHIITHGPKATAAIEDLSQRTGIDLVHDFTQAGLASKGFSGVMRDVALATNGNVEELYAIMPELRGLKFLMAAAKDGGAELADKLVKVTASTAGLDEQFKRNSENADVLYGRMKNQLNIAMNDLGKAILPVVVPLLKEFVDYISNHQEDIRLFAEHIGKLASEGMKELVKYAPAAFHAVREVISYAVQHKKEIVEVGGAVIGFAVAFKGVMAIIGVVKVVKAVVSVLKTFRIFITIGKWIAILLSWVGRLSVLWEGLIIVIAAIGIPFEVVIAIIAAVIAIGVLLWQNWDTIIAWAKKLNDDVDKWFRSIGFAIRKTIKDIIEGITSWMDDTNRRIYEGMIDAYNTFVDNWYKFWHAVIDFGNNIGKSISDTWNGIMNFFNNLNLWDVGKNIIMGLADGIKDSAWQVVNSLGNAVNGAVNGVRDTLKIFSPSRVMMEIGVYTGQGLALGIDKTQSMVKNSTGNLAQSIVSGSSNTNINYNTNNSSSKSGVNVVINVPSGVTMMSEKSLADLAKVAKRAFSNQGFVTA